jgi:hypothetical protein
MYPGTIIDPSLIHGMAKEREWEVPAHRQKKAGEKKIGVQNGTKGKREKQDQKNTRAR